MNGGTYQRHYVQFQLVGSGHRCPLAIRVGPSRQIRPKQCCNRGLCVLHGSRLGPSYAAANVMLSVTVQFQCGAATGVNDKVPDLTRRNVSVLESGRRPANSENVDPVSLYWVLENSQIQARKFLCYGKL